jgi:hypothetical protein
MARLLRKAADRLDVSGAPPFRRSTAAENRFHEQRRAERMRQPEFKNGYDKMAAELARGDKMAAGIAARILRAACKREELDVEVEWPPTLLSPSGTKDGPPS